MLLGVLLFFSAKQETDRLQDRESDEGVFGYDFSQGYTSLERNFTSHASEKSPGLLRQWLDGRRGGPPRAGSSGPKKRTIAAMPTKSSRSPLHEVGRDGLSEGGYFARLLLDRVSCRYRNRQRG